MGEESGSSWHIFVLRAQYHLPVHPNVSLELIGAHFMGPVLCLLYDEQTSNVLNPVADSLLKLNNETWVGVYSSPVNRFVIQFPSGDY